MNSKALAQVLSSYGNASEKGAAFEIGEGSAVTLYASFGGEGLIIGGITRVEMKEDMVVCKTRKDETYVVACEDVRAVRFGKGPAEKRTGLI